MNSQPRYERQHHRAVQDVVEAFLREETERTMPGIELYPAVVGACVDYVWKQNGKPVYLGEFKRRNNRHDEFPDYMISASKIVAIQRRVSIGWIIVLFTDGLFRIPIVKNMHVDIRDGGRTSQWRDSIEKGGERCAFFLPSQMKRFPRWNDHWDWKARHGAIL